MLPDQADNLRRLVSRNVSSDGPPRGRLTVLSGCKGGVGVTTLSLNVAVALRSQVNRVLLIDCNPHRGDLAAMYRLKGEYGIDDLIARRCTPTEAIGLGPAGIQVIPRFGISDVVTAASCWQLLRQLEEVTHSFDHIVIDAGCCAAVAEVLWPAADSAVVVTTTDQVALTDGYALVKSMHVRNATGNVSFVVNRYRDELRAIDIQERLEKSCQQFLGLEVKSVGRVPFADHWESAVADARSVVCARPASRVSAAIYEIARRVALGVATTSGVVATNNLNSVAAS